MNLRTVIISTLTTLLVLLLISAVGVVVAGPDGVPMGTSNDEHKSEEGPPDQIPPKGSGIGIPGHVIEHLDAINDLITGLMDNLVEMLKGVPGGQEPNFRTV